MAKGSKTKKSKTQKVKSKAKKDTKKKLAKNIEKKELTKVKESNSKKEKKIITKENSKINEKTKEIEEKTKEVKKEVIKKRKIPKKSRKKIIRLIIITVIFIALLVLLLILNKKNYTNNVSFVTRNNITLSKINDTFSAPVYSFAIDKKNNPVDVENLRFMDKEIFYRFYDAKREELDDGSVLISIPCDMDVELEYVIDEDVDTDWMYTFSYAPVFAFDYYSGDIYHENTISDSKLVLMDEIKENNEDNKNKKSKNKEKQEDKMAYTDQVYNNKKISIGVLNNSTKSNWSSNIYQGNKDDGKHFKVDNKSTTIIYIKASKNYDGLALAINKNGANYDTWKKEYDYYEKIISLKEEEKKSGEKSKELEKIEKEKETIHKLLDKSDELRKDYLKDDFYVIRVTDLFKDDYLIKEENCINLIYITGILVSSLGILTCMFMIIGERNKAYGKYK